MNTVPALLFCLFAIHFTIILPWMPRSSMWSLTFTVSNYNSVRPSLLSHVCHMPCLSHPPSFNNINNIWQGYKSQISTWEIFSNFMLLPPLQVHIPPSALCSCIPSMHVLPLMWHTNFHTLTKQQAKLQLHRCVKEEYPSPQYVGGFTANIPVNWNAVHNHI